MSDIIQRLILDDSDFINKIQAINPVVDKVAHGFDAMQKEVNQTTKAIGNDLVQANQKAAKSIDQVTQATINESKAMQKQKQDIADITMAIAKSEGTGQKLVALFKKLEDAKLKGVSANIQDIENEFTDLLSKVKLTDQQIEFLSDNIKEVAQNVSNIQSDEFNQLAANAEKTTGKFISAKTELRQLTSLINSGQLTGDELVQATQRAARLTDEIGDVRTQIKKLSSDTRALDLFAEGVNGIGAGFQIAEGAAALFGDESEDLQKQLVKLNAVMAIANGLQQAGTILTQRGGLATKAATIAQGAYTAVVGGSTGALKLFRIALASTGIGLLVIGLGVLISNWDKVKKSVSENAGAIFEFGKKITFFIPPLNLLVKGLEYLYNNFDKIGSAVSGAGRAIESFFGGVGDSLGKLFSGDFSGALESFKNIGKDAGKAFEEGFAEGEKERADKILAKEIDAMVKNQKKREEILKAGGKETAKLGKEILENELKSLELQRADIEKIEEKKHEIAVFNAARSKELADKAEKDRQERDKKTQEALKKFKSIQDELFNSINENGGLNDKEKFELIKEKQIDQLKEFQTELTKIAKITGKDVSKEFNNLQEMINGISARDFTSTFEPIEKLPLSTRLANKELTILENRLKELKLSELKFGINTQDLQAQIQSEIEKIGNEGIKSEDPLKVKVPELTIVPAKTDIEIDDSQILEGINNFEDLFNSMFDDIFGDRNSDKAKEFFKGLGSFVNEFGNLLNEANDIQIEAIDKQLDRLGERREKAEDDLDHELELQEDNLANSASVKQTEVDSLLAEETRLTEEKDKIQKEAQRRQILADSVQQGQSLITAGINIIKGFSNIPIIGLPLGIAAVAALGAFFVKNKIEALKATRLSSGARRIDDYIGEVAPGGASDIHGRGQGYRVVDAVSGHDTNVIISGREWLFDEETTNKQRKLFEGLRAGKYNFDIAEVLDINKGFRNDVQTGSVNNTIVNNVNQLPLKQWVPFKTKAGKQAAILKDIPQGENGSIIYFDM